MSMRSSWSTFGFGLLAGLLAAAVIWLAVSPARSQPVALLPTPLPRNLTIQISGAVQTPGVYTLTPGSRIQDAINAAGGLLGISDPSSLNLAAPISDGEKINIPVPGDDPPPLAIPEKTDPIEITGPVNINTATLEELDTLPGIGPAIAGRIIDYRQKNGPFDKIEDIQNVSGIGPATFEKLKPLITISSGN